MAAIVAGQLTVTALCHAVHRTRSFISFYFFLPVSKHRSLLMLQQPPWSIANCSQSFFHSFFFGLCCQWQREKKWNLRIQVDPLGILLLLFLLAVAKADSKIDIHNTRLYKHSPKLWHHLKCWDQFPLSCPIMDKIHRLALPSKATAWRWQGEIQKLAQKKKAAQGSVLASPPGSTQEAISYRSFFMPVQNYCYYWTYFEWWDHVVVCCSVTLILTSTPATWWRNVLGWSGWWRRRQRLTTTLSIKNAWVSSRWQIVCVGVCVCGECAKAQRGKAREKSDWRYFAARHFEIWSNSILCVCFTTFSNRGHCCFSHKRHTPLMASNLWEDSRRLHLTSIKLWKQKNRRECIKAEKN